MPFALVRRDRHVNAVSLALILLLAGCSHVNKPLNRVEIPLDHRRQNNTRASRGPQVAQDASEEITDANPRTSDGYFVGLALSGGGSRSANFSAACMFQLERLGLLQRVDYISSVSGGSLTSAFYCLNGADWNPSEVQQRLTHPFASDVIVSIIMPWNAAALMFSSWDRSDLIASSFRDFLYSQNGRAQTFADLRDDRPRLLINATDLQSGRRFVFCNESFDELNSDLASYPIAYAVAASAAVPVLMHQVTLRDYSTTFKQYRHLIDGGVTDNLGVVTLVETYNAQVQAALERRQRDPYPNGAILLVIDARTRFDAQISDKADVGVLEGLAAGAGLTSTALLNRVSSATLAEIIVQYSPDEMTARKLREEIKALEDVGVLTLRDQHGKPVQVVHIALSRLDDVGNLPFQSFSEKVNTMATYFNINPTEAYHLYKAAELLVRERFEPRLRELADELDVPRAAPATAPAK